MTTLSNTRPTWLYRFYRRLHLPEPDFSRPRLELSPEQAKGIMDKLVFLYGEKKAEACFSEILRIMRVYYAHKPLEMIEEEKHFDPRERFTDKDVILITYGDLIRSPQRRPLRALADFLRAFMKGSINTIHILPFFPYSSDRGFSITDYEEVDSQLGPWEDIEQLSTQYRLMFDGVFNHVSSKSRWFQQFLMGNPHYEDFFIRFAATEAIREDHLKLILRPRVSSLLTPFDTVDGKRYVWTTFSPDQIDLNFKNYQVLVRVAEILLYYVRRGADLIRLDAVTYLWAELGTSCAHLAETHALVQLFRAILDVVAPHVALVTESNVPHRDNISYFGDGGDEAQVVYNFALPPLVLLSFQKADCTVLSQWAATSEKVSDTCTYFNFLDSHDGVGLLAVKDLLSEEQVNDMIQTALEHGGVVSYKDNPDGTVSPYEIDITWYSALNKENDGESLDLKVSRFVASRAIALALRGVPGVYLPGLFGARNDLETVLDSGEPRRINRKNIDEEALLRRLGDRSSSAFKIAARFGELIDKRINTPAFHPNGSQRILEGNPAVFALLRVSPDGSHRVVALTNVAASRQEVAFSASELDMKRRFWRDIITGEVCRSREGGIEITLEPYQVRWLCPQ